MKIATCEFFALCFIDVIMVSSQLLTSTPCADFGTVPKPFFSKNLYKGTWFVYQNYDAYGTNTYDCYVSIRTPNAAGNQDTREYVYAPGQPTINSSGVTVFNKPLYGQFIYTNTEYPNNPREFQILDTDYNNYAIEWNCMPYRSESRCELYIMSRKAVVSTLTQKKIAAVLDKYHISRAELRTLNISTCPAEVFKNPSSPGLLGGVLGAVTGLVNNVVNTVGGLLQGVIG